MKSKKAATRKKMAISINALTVKEYIKAMFVYQTSPKI